MSEYKYVVPLVYGTGLQVMSGETFPGINAYGLAAANLSADASTYKTWTKCECIIPAGAEPEDDGRMVWRAAVTFSFAPGGVGDTRDILNWRWYDATNAVTLVSGQVTYRGTAGYPSRYEVATSPGPKYGGAPSGPLLIVFQYATSIYDVTKKPGWSGGPGFLEIVRL